MFWFSETILMAPLVPCHLFVFIYSVTILILVAFFCVFTVDELNKHMHTLRTIFSKVVNPPSGSGVCQTERQQEVVRLLTFLKDHVRPRKGHSNLKIAAANEVCKR